MELRTLHYFTVVVEEGSLTAAARRLHMSQPPLSVAIGKLESELGSPLLVRTPRGVEPTSAGRYLLDAASRVLSDAREIETTLSGYGQGAVGTVTVAAVPTLTWQRIPSLLRSLHSTVPGIGVRLTDPPPWTAIDMLHQRSVDLAAVMVADPDRFRARHQADLDIYDWGEIPLVGVLPPEESDAPDPLPLTAFEGRDLVLPRRTAAVPSLPEAVDDALFRAGVAPASVVTVETIQTGLPLIEAGTGRGILPDPDRRSLERFHVTVRALQPRPTPLRALVLTRRDPPPGPAVRRLVREMDAEMPARDNV